MDVETFKNWIQRQGHKVVQYENTYWYDATPGVFLSFPYHSLHELSPNTLRQIFKVSHAAILKYSTPLSSPEGKISYHVMFDKNEMALPTLPKKVRHDIANGLKYAKYERISMSRLAVDGWQLRQDTLIRQGRKNAEKQQNWVKLCLSAENLPGFEAWGAIVNGQLAASILTTVIGDCAYILYQQSQTEHLKYGVNNTLAYIYTNDALQRPGINKIFYGLHSLDAPSSVDEFKFRMGFYAYPVKQRIAINPIISPLFNNMTYNFLTKLLRFSKDNSTFAKIEGIFRFYLQGKRPIAEQDWPDGLIENKESILATSINADREILR